MRISLLLLCAVTAWSAEPAVIPAELVGTWGYTETRAITYRNRSTGAFARPSGSSSKITIHPDGTFEDFDLIQQSMYNCTETVFIKRTGYVVTEGSSIALHYEGGHVSSKDTCAARFNYEKQAIPELKTYDAWRIQPGPNGEQLLMASGGKLILRYTRQVAH